MKKLIILLTLFSTVLVSCNNDDDGMGNPPLDEKGTLVLNFNFKAGDEDVVLGNSVHVIANEDTVTYNQFKFILSNLNLTGSGNDDWLNDEGYYLVKADADSSNFSLHINDVPAGTYSTLEFFIGMDSAMNFKPESFPILFQQEGMYWSWNTGYKFLVLEGDYFSSDLGTPGDKLPFIAHVGDMQNLKIPSFNLNIPVVIENGSTEELNFNVDLKKIHSSPNRLSFDEATNLNIQGGPKSSLLAENYGDGMILIIQ